MLSPAGPRSGLRNLGCPASAARRPGASNFDPVGEGRGHGAAAAGRGAGALSTMPRCYALIPCGSEAILPHDVARGYFRRVDPWRTHGGLVAWLIGRGACGTHGRIDRAAVLRMACVRGRLCGVRAAACPTGPPAFLAVRTVACVGALRWPRWRGPPPRLALRRRLPAASAGDRGSAVTLRTRGVRARARVDWWLRPATDLAVS